MSNAARKARKRAGEKFHREPKVGTPLEERILRPTGYKTQIRTGRQVSARHQKKIQEAIAFRDSQ